MAESELGFSVFPTHVGVNRLLTRRTPARLSIPHARGGEPDERTAAEEVYAVFPTHVGVNRLRVAAGSSGTGIPHARGGEPAVLVHRLE